MLRKVNNIVIITCCCFFLFACSATKNIPDNDALYTGASVKVNAPSSVNTRQKKTLRNDLKGVTAPKPNSRFLGIPFKLHIYNFFYKSKPGSMFGKLRDQWGEPPALVSQVNLPDNINNLTIFLENKGFFNAEVTGDTIVKKKKAKAEYEATTGEQYMIAKVVFPPDSSDLEKFINQTANETLLKIGAPFDLDLIRGERVRIDAYLKENGFYYFNPDNLLIKADSTNGEHKVDLYVTVKPDIPPAARQIFLINDVYVYADYNLATARLDTNKADAIEFRNYLIIDKNNKYKPRLITRNMQFNPGEVYNRADHNQTLNRLINLNLFKFVKNRFEPTTWLDTPRLNTYYYLTALPKRTLRAEITGTTKTNNFTGSEVTLSWFNRNTFRGGEQLRFNVYVGSEIQRSGTLQGFNTYRTGAEASLTLPKFLIPFYDVRNQGAFAPRTQLRLGYDVLNKRKLYTLNSFRGQYGYIWRQNPRRSNELFPVSITYVQPLNVTQAYKDTLLIFPTLARATERQFILGSTYQFTYNDLVSSVIPPKSFFINGLVDLSGNIAGLLMGANIKDGDTAKLFNAAFSQYVKLEGDGRYYQKIGLNNRWANRIILGFGLPYGNSLELPFIKQFFVGGNNSVRAFRSRSVGPGTYRDTGISAMYLPDQTGDIKLEVNTELRPRISGPLYGAIFIDAGNVWLYNDERWTGKPGAKFTNKFLSQLAVGAGVGIRLDIQLFVIRLDVAFPLRKPWEQNPWVMNNIRLNKQVWREENIVYNLAIGYPF